MEVVLKTRWSKDKVDVWQAVGRRFARRCMQLERRLPRAEKWAASCPQMDPQMGSASRAETEKQPEEMAPAIGVEE
jgi:hypothetical protein